MENSVLCFSTELRCKQKRSHKASSSLAWDLLERISYFSYSTWRQNFASFFNFSSEKWNYDAEKLEKTFQFDINSYLVVAEHRKSEFRQFSQFVCVEGDTEVLRVISLSIFPTSRSKERHKRENFTAFPQLLACLHEFSAHNNGSEALGPPEASLIGFNNNFSYVFIALCSL